MTAPNVFGENATIPGGPNDTDPQVSKETAPETMVKADEPTTPAPKSTEPVEAKPLTEEVVHEVADHDGTENPTVK